MISRFSTLCVLLSALALSACGGGANLKFEEQLKADLAASEARVAELQQDVTDALAAAKEATDDATEALRAATAAEKRADDAEQQHAAEAARLRQAADDARAEAEDAKAAAEQARRDAQAAQARADEAARQTQAAEAQRQAAEQRQQALEDEAEEAQRRANAAEAKQILAGLDTAIPSAVVNVTGKHRAVATVTTTPPTGSSASGSSMGRWFKTSRSARTQAHADRLDVYTDVEAPKGFSEN